MNTYETIIFVCNGNTCRGPMAAAIMKKIMPDVITKSRGMVVLFPEPYNPKAVAVAAKHDVIIPSDSAVQIVNEDFGLNTLVLTMNASMKQKMDNEFSEAINVYTLGEYAGDAEIEVKDPYGKGVDEYNACFELLYSLLVKVADKLNNPKEGNIISIE